MKRYGGIDLHSNHSVVALLDEEDCVVYRQRLGNDAALVLDALAPYREAITGWVVESTYNWYWLVDALMDAGYRVHLANTAAILQYSGLKYSDDDSDAALEKGSGSISAKLPPCPDAPESIMMVCDQWHLTLFSGASGSIDGTAVAHSDDFNDQAVVFDRVHHAIPSHSYPIGH
jgi:hypothetical protein